MNYELMLVAVNDRADQLLTRVQKSLKDDNAAEVKVERLGKKQLAYPIKKQTDATYFVINFEGTGDVIGPIGDKLRLEQEDLLRYLLIRKENKKIKSRKVKGIKEAREIQAAEPVKEEKEKPKVTVVTKVTKSVKAVKAAKPAVTKATKAVKKPSKAAKKGKK